jgi:hypothetical protein
VLKIIGTDTEEFLRENNLLKYLKVIDADFSELGVNKNYVVLTHLEIPDNETVLCVCFYFTRIPKTFTSDDGAKIISDHADMLQDLSVFVHFAIWNESNLEELNVNPTKEARSEVFERTVFE